jgi:hypothetical protein
MSSYVPLLRDFLVGEGTLLSGEEMHCLPGPCVRAMQACRPMLSPYRFPLALACRLGAPLHTGVLRDHNCDPNGELN